ncbi:unnamed protein product [Symbiodinium necroappetens]|uniref:Fe2OG dioxygenase domain-containing protein n=1 Tax=Symbiodinium necroappetens TaxID=1628268 RepID=A0A812RFB5_9DINO|nr:unnamed protein product [Symbiodinium necroappetens]
MWGGKTSLQSYCGTTRHGFHVRSVHVLHGLYTSKETCGSVNLYDPTRHSKELGGNIIRAVVAPYPPWVIQRNSSTGIFGLTGFDWRSTVWCFLESNMEYGGPSYDFLQSVLNLFDPPAQLNLLPGWATEQSRQRFSSSYTACVHDVAVGNFDICIADLWLTPNRHRLAWFLPTIRQDLFYLVVPRKFDEVTLLSYLQRPFLPFTPDAWLGVFAFLCGLSAVLWLVRLCETPAKERQGCQWSLQELGNFLFNTWHDFLLGQSSHEVERGLAHKLFSLAFSFFILVTLASYTASLASMLVVQREASGEINSIDDAITAGVPICAPAVLTPTFSTLFGAATFVDCDAIAECARILHSGRCRAMIVSEDIITSLHAGLIQQADCDDVNAGRVSEEVGRCTTTETNSGNARNDCELLRVGDLLWSVPLSFPISERLAHGMSWAVTQAITAGLFERAKDSELNKEAFPLSQCAVVEDRSEEDGLTLADLTGTIVISMFMVGFGLVCFTVQVLRRDGRELLQRSRTFGQTTAEPEVLEEVRTLTGQEKCLETAVTDAATSPAVSWEMGSQDADQEPSDPAPDPVPIQEPRESRAQTSPLAEEWQHRNEALKAGQLPLAIACYTMAISAIRPLAETAANLKQNAAVYSSNRSAAFAKLKQWYFSLGDAEEAARLSPQWYKAHLRIATAYLGQGHAEHAYKTYLFASELPQGYAEAMKECVHALWQIPLLESPLAKRRVSRFDEDKNKPRGSCRIFAISDVHIDHGGSVLKWAEGINDKEFKNDILIVAGDLGDTFNAIKSEKQGADALKGGDSSDSEVAMQKWSQLTSRLQRHTVRGVRTALEAHSGAPTAALRHGDGTAHIDAGCMRAPNFTCHPGGDKDVSGLGAGDSELLAKFLTEEEADQAFKALCPGGEIEYQQWYHMPDKKKPYQPLKRLQRVKVAMADPQERGLPWYRFPVNDQQRYGILPMSPTVRMLCDRVNQRLNGSFNHVVVLYYADGNECIGYHKDKTLDLDENSSIVSISLGRPGRPYVLRDGIFNPTTETEVLLPHGGLFRLGPETNKTFYHAVRQTETPENAGARVSITFRHVISYETAGTLTGKGAEFPTLNWPVQLNGQHRLDEDLDQALERPESAAAPKATVSKKVAGPQLSPADVELLRTCLAEASLEDFFVANDLKGAGLAARAVMLEKVGEARGAELSKALGSRIGEAYHAWKKATRAKPEPAAIPAAPLETQATTPATADARPAEPAWSLGGMLSRWIWGEPDPTPEELLTYWFGVEPYKFRGGLWWRGIDPASPLDGQEGTDQRILNKYGTLIRSCQHGLAKSKVAAWANTSEGKAALVVLLDQMPRNAFRGTAEMFAYDALAQEMATKLLQCEQVPWPHATFAQVALMHSEDVATVEASALGLLRLASEVEPHIANRLKSMHNEAKTHSSVLRSFGRYPHRNELLGRESSAAELSWLRSKNLCRRSLPSWAQSVRPKFQKKLEGESQEVQKIPDLVAQPSGPKLRILVLHSNRQNAGDFKRKTRGPLEPLEAVADLHYLDGPHVYTPMGEAHDSVGKLGANAPKNRCWWNATDDPATMRYVGLEKTLEHVENCFHEHGPFDGVMGFSQGGCLAGLLAALQPRPWA